MQEILKTKEVVAPPADTEKQRHSWQRVVFGTVLVTLGVAAAVAGIALIKYRLTHVVVEDGLINGRIVRLQAPASGNFKAFYARPGVLVRAEQVLARIGIERNPQEDEQVSLRLERSQAEQIRSQLERSKLTGEIQANASQLAAARQSLNFLKNQLQTLKNQYDAVQGVDLQIASEGVSQQQAALEAAVAKAKATHSEYERHQNLRLPTHQTEMLQLAWKSATAEVEQAKAALRSAQASLSAAKNGVALSNQNTVGGTLSDQRTKLLQAIQTQEAVVSNLEALVTSGRQQLNQFDLYKNRPSLVSDHAAYPRKRQVQEVLAPFAGVVYSTEYEQGEHVTQSERILTLLDCNNLWIETVVRADEASRIDTQKPVSVQLKGYSETVVGEVDLLQPISSIQGIEERSKLMQVQALLPAIQPMLVGQPLARVTVRIPPPPEHTKSQRFCGLGQSARLTFSKKPFSSN